MANNIREQIAVFGHDMAKGVNKQGLSRFFGGLVEIPLDRDSPLVAASVENYNQFLKTAKVKLTPEQELAAKEGRDLLVEGTKQWLEDRMVLNTTIQVLENLFDSGNILTTKGSSQEGTILGSDQSKMGFWTEEEFFGLLKFTHEPYDGGMYDPASPYGDIPNILRAFWGKLSAKGNLLERVKRFKGNLPIELKTTLGKVGISVGGITSYDFKIEKTGENSFGLADETELRAVAFFKIASKMSNFYLIRFKKATDKDGSQGISIWEFKLFSFLILSNLIEELQKGAKSFIKVDVKRVIPNGFSISTKPPYIVEDKGGKRPEGKVGTRYIGQATISIEYRSVMPEAGNVGFDENFLKNMKKIYKFEDDLLKMYRGTSDEDKTKYYSKIRALRESQGHGTSEHIHIG